MRPTPPLLGLILLLALVIAACGSDDALRADLTITAPLAGAPNAAVHGTVTAPSDDQLVAVASPACGGMELHESLTDADGRHLMRPIGTIDLPGRRTVDLEAGGLHIMCLDVDASLAPGDTIDIALTLASGGVVDTTADVVDHLADDEGHDH